MGATLLILANKQDLQGALPAAEIKKVWVLQMQCMSREAEGLVRELRQLPFSFL